MKRTKRNSLGQITGKEDMSYFFTSDIENESWTDRKVKAKDIRFPVYEHNLNGECITYSIEELHNAR